MKVMSFFSEEALQKSPAEWWVRSLGKKITELRSKKSDESEYTHHLAHLQKFCDDPRGEMDLRFRGHSLTNAELRVLSNYAKSILAGCDIKNHVRKKYGL